MKKYNVILSINESEVLKHFCIQEGIKFFRTEYWDKRYCEVEVSEEQKKMVDEFLNDLSFVIKCNGNLIAVFKHGDDDWSIADCINDWSVRGSFDDISEELSKLPTEVWETWQKKRKEQGLC